MKLSIQHETIYTYDAPVRSSTQYLRLTPRDTLRHKVLQWELDTPRAATQTHDGYGNTLHVLTLDKAVREIRIRAHGVVEAVELAGEQGGAALGELSPLVFLRPTAITRADASLTAFAGPFRRQGAVLTGLRELAVAITKRMPASDEATEPPTAADAFAACKGSARDHVHVFIACCRHLGVPARYVSGYVLTHGKGEPSIAGHAWAEAWIVDRWRSFDLGNSRSTGAEHIEIAIGADYFDACPIRGVRTGGGLETMQARAKVTVTK
ncbi:MAG: transglutaminase family protein [Betaproteobacteria bacterium]